MVAPQPAGEPEPQRLERLLPGGPSAPIPELVEWMGLWERPQDGRARPRVLLNMVSTLDGRATLCGHSGPLSNPYDRELFHALRAPVDAVLVGAGTVRTEHYGRLLREERYRRERLARGLPEEPLACIVSGRLALPQEIGLLQEPSARVVLITSSAASLPAAEAQVEYLRQAAAGKLDLSRALLELRARYDVRSVLCEGGPHLARELFGAGLVDELFLTLSPLLAGGEPSGGEAMRILAGEELQPPCRLELVSLMRGSSTLFLRYAVVSEERV